MTYESMHRASTVAVVGLGKIGLPLAVQYARQGWRVIGCDINSEVVDKINAGQSHIYEEPELVTELPYMVSRGSLYATTDTAEAVRQASVVVVIVPVMIDDKHEVNFEAIDAATAAIGAGLQPGTLVIYETTLPVGTTSGRLCQILKGTANLQAGRDFHLAYSPERVSSGHIFHDLRTYPKVVGGIDAPSTAAADTFYRSVLEADVITMASTDEAEFVKLIETTYRDVNIALANEYASYADLHGLDVRAAIAAANTQPYSHIHNPGVGVGGHCIPVYPYFLLSGLGENPEQGSPSLQVKHRSGGSVDVEADKSTQSAINRPLQLPYSARRINDAMAEYAVKRIEALIGSLAHQSVLILGVAYRGNVRETAFTSAKLLQDELVKSGASVYVDDPLFSDEDLRAWGYIPLAAGQEGDIQAIILQADHQAYQELDFRRYTHCKVVLDGRRALSRERIEASGIRYIAIGDGGREANQKIPARATQASPPRFHAAPAPTGAEASLGTRARATQASSPHPIAAPAPTSHP